MSSYLGLLEVAAADVPTPPAGKVRFFLDSADGVPSFKDPSGTVTKVTSSDPELAAIAGLVSAADRGIVFTGSGTAALFTLTAAGLALLDDADTTAQRTTLGLAIGTNVQAFDQDLADIAALADARGDVIIRDASTWVRLPIGAANKVLISDGTDVSWGYPLESFLFAASDETTALTTGDGKITFRLPAMTLIGLPRGSLTTASTSGAVTVDITKGGTSIFSTLLTIDQDERTSTTAATPAVVSDTSIADDAEMQINIDGAGTGAKGLKVLITGRRT